MTNDSALPFLEVPASKDAVYLVEGRRIGIWVEVTLTRAHRQRHRFGADRYTRTDVLAMKRFRGRDIAGYTTYGGRLQDAARIAGRGGLGYSVDTATENGAVAVSLISRLLTPDGRVETEITRETRFEDADSVNALVQANERATELRAEAERLNEEWAEAVDAQVRDLRAEYDRQDAEAQAAEDLRRIVDATGD